MTAQLIQQLREQRMKWIELEPGKEVRIIRPTELELVQHFIKDRAISVGYEEAKRFVVDWRGITGADVLGAAVGSADPIAFDAELWAEVVADRMAWVNKVAQELLDQIVEHRTAIADQAKN